MKKSLIALAIAGAFAAPAFAATGNVDVYGVLNVAVEDTDINGDTPAIVSNVSRIGFKGSEDLGGGLKAVWQIESALDGTGAAATTDIGGTALATRNTFIGLAGSFGTVLMGRHDTPYKLGTGSLDPFADTIADYNTGRVDGVQLLDNNHDARVRNALAYVSPTWSGFHFAAAVVMSDDGTVDNLAGFDNNSMDATSLTAVYANGPLFGSLSYQNVTDIATGNATDEGTSAWKLGLGYTFGDAKVGFIYEDVNYDVGTGVADRDSWQLNGVYNMGPMALKAAYGKVDLDVAAPADEQDMWALGLDYNLSKRTVGYVVYASGDNNVGADVAGWNIGMKHSF